MIKECISTKKICDGCSKCDTENHVAMGLYSSEWVNIKGYDLCPLCEAKVKSKLYEKADVNIINDILATIPKA